LEDVMKHSEFPFDSAIARYLTIQRALGRAFVNEERVLNSLSRFLREQRLDDLEQTGIDAWCQSFPEVHTNTRRGRLGIVRNFCLYRRRTEPDCFVPDINRFPRLVPYRMPVILGPADIIKLLAASAQIKRTSKSPLKPAVMRLAVILLYTTGLRLGELVRLTLADADVAAGVLHVRESKFHKSRFLPLSVDAQRELSDYLRQRLVAPFSTAPEAPLLCHCTEKFRGYCGEGLGTGLRAIFRIAKVRSSDGRSPHVHDFRHSFAQEALLRWYRQGADVQSKLPKLALYMGHVSIASTSYYLKWIPARAEIASQRFETHFGHLIDGGTS
jgi:integrase/recombinase XerD